MNIWRVMYWRIDRPSCDWPEVYDYVPGCDWFEAVENTRTKWNLKLGEEVHAIEVRVSPALHWIG